ncbi:MAG: hypothetical protein HVK45_01480 [Pelagibacteraceae bacterium]|nr:hypothetical protein [Pelagibacteraceae bacterium]
MKRLWFKYLSLILIVVNTSILFAQFEKNALVLKRELILNSHVIGQEKQDVLKFKNGSTYNGEFVKIESGNVLFKHKDVYNRHSFYRIKINEIKMLKLSDGTEIINWGKIKRKAKETITIQPGDKIMVTYDTISKSVTGSFYGFDNGEISIQKFDKDQKAFYTIIPANLVANIIVLPIKSAESVPQVAISCGFIMVALSASDGFDAEVGLTMGVLGAITGGLGGFILDKIENKRAFKDARYTLLGKDAWYIDNQDIK